MTKRRQPFVVTRIGKKIGRCVEIVFHKAPTFPASLPKFTCPLQAWLREQNMGFQVKFIEVQPFLDSLEEFVLNLPGMYCHSGECYRS